MNMNDSGNGKEDAALKQASLEADEQAKNIEANKSSDPAPKVYNFQKRKNPISPAKPASKEQPSVLKEAAPLSGAAIQEPEKAELAESSEKPVQEAPLAKPAEAPAPAKDVASPAPVKNEASPVSPKAGETPLEAKPQKTPAPQAPAPDIEEKKAVVEPLPRCPECGEELPRKGLKFCPFCGKSLIPQEAKKEETKAKAKLHCNDCGKDIFQGNMRFCPYCGSSDLVKLDETPSTPATPAKPVTPPLAPAMVAAPIAAKAVPEARHCPKCGRPLPLDFVGEYCPYCGGPLSKEVEAKEKRCPKCGKILPPDADKNCPYCGTSLKIETSGAKTCPSCHRALPKDATEFCPYCGGILPKEKPHMERKCPRCEHVLADDVDGFCPYCGTSLQGGKPAYELFNEKKKCPRCGKPLPADADAYCPYCGEELPLVGKACPKCGKILPPDADKNCPYCGEELHPLTSATPVTPFVVPEAPYPKLPFKMKKMRPAILIFLALTAACGGFGLFLLFNLAKFSGVPYFTALLYSVYFLVAELGLSFLGLILAAIPLKRERQILGWALFLDILSFFLALAALAIFAFTCVLAPKDIPTMVSLLSSLDYSALYAQAGALISSLVSWILLGIARGDAKKLEAGVKGFRWTNYGANRPSLINNSVFCFILFLGVGIFLYFVFVPKLSNTINPTFIYLMLRIFAFCAFLFLVKTILLFPLPKNSKPLAIIGLVLTILSLPLAGYGYYLFGASLVVSFFQTGGINWNAIVYYLLPVGVIALLLFGLWIGSLVKSIKAVRAGYPKEKK